VKGALSEWPFNSLGGMFSMEVVRSSLGVLLELLLISHLHETEAYMYCVVIK